MVRFRLGCKQLSGKAEGGEVVGEVSACVSWTRSFIRFSELESLSLDMIRWLVT
jgi:hypothetical protein